MRATTSSSFADRAIVALAAAVAAAAVVARVHDVVAYPAIHDWDASGHAVNVIDLMEGHLPDPRSWVGSHGPVYYAIGAALWRLLPDAVPVHVTLRGVSVAAWLATIWLVWRTLRRLGSASDAAVVAALLLGVPGLVIASCMMTNDALCALFVTATLSRLVAVSPDTPVRTRDVAITAALAGLAALTKSTGVAAIGITAGWYVWRLRREPRRALQCLVTVAVVAGAIAGPHYLHLWMTLSGSPYDILAARAGSREKDAIAAVVAAAAPPMHGVASYVGLLHAALWGDPTAVYLPHDDRVPFGALAIGGGLVAAVAAAGALRMALRPELARRVGVALVFGILYAAALAPHAASVPTVVLTKVNYLLPEALPAGILLAAGLAWVTGAAGVAVRVLLLTVAATGVATTWYGWWLPMPAPTAIVIGADADSPAGAVERYFAWRASDPIRAVRMLAPDVQEAHALRLARMLGVPLAPDGELDPAAARSLELARARVAWLELDNLVRWIEPTVAAFRVTVGESNGAGDTAEVVVRVAPGDVAPFTEAPEMSRWPFPAFEQRFTLQRHDGAWRITAVRQTGVSDANAVQAFAAHPTFGGLERLRALGWRPSWEDATDAARRHAS